MSSLKGHGRESERGAARSRERAGFDAADENRGVRPPGAVLPPPS